MMTIISLSITDKAVHSLHIKNIWCCRYMVGLHLVDSGSPLDDTNNTSLSPIEGGIWTLRFTHKADDNAYCFYVLRTNKTHLNLHLKSSLHGFMGLWAYGPMGF